MTGEADLAVDLPALVERRLLLGREGRGADGVEAAAPGVRAPD